MQRFAILALASCSLGGCMAPAPAPRVQPDAQISRIDRSLAAAARYLVSRQSPDGRWTSAHYGSFRDDLALTPHVLSALAFLPQGGDSARAAFDRGVNVLRTSIAADQPLDQRADLAFPVYTAAEASWLFTLHDASAQAHEFQRRWLDYIYRLQLDERLGWNPSDAEFGGWGYSVTVPRKLPAGVPRGPLVESNLSATIFAIGALVSADMPRDDPAFHHALVLVQRCQNLSADARRADPAFDDGGFFFIPGDAAKNKAGVAGTDRNGQTRFHSYGSMTADGVRALLQCGLPPTHPRVVAARRWLERNFSVEHNAGRWAEDRRILRDAAYYYYCWSLAHALSRLGMRTLQTPAGLIDWPTALSNELIRRQKPDGSWANEFTDSKEDEPLVATPFAAAALAICRMRLAGVSTLHGHSGAVQVTSN